MNEMSELVHVFHHCYNCGAAPIVGTRHHCPDCPDGPDNDLCSRCFELYQRGLIDHPHKDSHAATMNIKNHRFETYQGKPVDQYEKWLSVSPPSVEPPLIPDRFVIRPVFSAGADAIIASYSFAVCIDDMDTPILLTALHVMDGLIKKKGIDCSVDNKAYTGRELPSVITKADMFDVFASNWMLAPLGTAGPMLVLPESGTGGEEPYSKQDIAAFVIKDSSAINPLPLAEESPGIGEPVWVAVKVDGEQGTNTLSAVVAEKTDDTFVFLYDDPDKNAPYSSGAPILNKHGQVVGINVGGGFVRTGKKIGHANHVENIHRHLQHIG